MPRSEVRPGPAASPLCHPSHVPWPLTARFLLSEGNARSRNEQCLFWGDFHISTQTTRHPLRKGTSQEAQVQRGSCGETEAPSPGG